MASNWGNADDKTSTGTVQIHANGLVDGTSTLFTSEAQVGDYIDVEDTTTKYRIISITDNTTAHVAAQVNGDPVVAVAAGNNYLLQEAPRYVSEVSVGVSANDVFGVDLTEAGLQSWELVGVSPRRS